MKLLLSCLVILLQSASLFAISPIDCNFETDFCNWTSINFPVYFRTNSTHVEPGHDHTCSIPHLGPNQMCGTWLTTSLNVSENEWFTLMSSVVHPTTSPACLKFWYHFSSLEANQLFEVYHNNRANAFNADTIWSVSTPTQSNDWIQAFVQIPKQNDDYYVLFHTILSPNKQVILGLDDITLTLGECQLIQKDQVV